MPYLLGGQILQQQLAWPWQAAVVPQACTSSVAVVATSLPAESTHESNILLTLLLSEKTD